MNEREPFCSQYSRGKRGRESQRRYSFQGRETFALALPADTRNSASFLRYPFSLPSLECRSPRNEPRDDVNNGVVFTSLVFRPSRPHDASRCPLSSLHPPVLFTRMYAHARIYFLSLSLSHTLSFSPRKPDVRINNRSEPLLCRCGIKVSSREGLAGGGVDSGDESTEKRSGRRNTAGLAARINHSSNLREITPCNRSAGFVISARSAVKRPPRVV